MIEKLSKLTITLIIFITCSVSVYANFAVSLDLNNSQTDNLMNDSSATDSPIRSGALGLKYYPISNLELSGTLKHTMYDEIISVDERNDTIITDITNSLYGFSATWIPAKPENKTNLYFNTSFDRVLYKDDSVKAYDNAIFALSASIGYKYKPTIHLRAGAKFTNNNYLDEESIDADNIQYELFTGVNFSLPGSNSLDIEGGFGVTSLQAIDVVKYPTYPINPYIPDAIDPNEFLEKGSFQSFHISPRFSRSIGKKTGVSLTFTYRHFTGVDNSVILDYSTSFLSPWSSFYDGTSAVFRLKSYIVPHMIISAGAGYWDKTKLKTIENIMKEVVNIDPFGDTINVYEIQWFTEPEDTKYRKEWLSRVYIDVNRPITFHRILIVPSISIDYKKNRSTSDAYDYSSTTFSFGLSLSDTF